MLHCCSDEMRFGRLVGEIAMKCEVTQACACARIRVGLVRVCAHITSRLPAHTVFFIRFHSYYMILYYIYIVLYYYTRIMKYCLCIILLSYTTVHYYYYFIAVVVVSCLCTRVSLEWGWKRTCSPIPRGPPQRRRYARRPAGACVRCAVQRVRAFSSLAEGSKNIRDRRKSACKNTPFDIRRCVCVCAFCTPLQQYVYNIIRLFVINILRVTIRWCNL